MDRIADDARGATWADRERCTARWSMLSEERLSSYHAHAKTDADDAFILSTSLRLAEHVFDAVDTGNESGLFAPSAVVASILPLSVRTDALRIKALSFVRESLVQLLQLYRDRLASKTLDRGVVSAFTDDEKKRHVSFLTRESLPRNTAMNWATVRHELTQRWPTSADTIVSRMVRSVASFRACVRSTVAALRFLLPLALLRVYGISPCPIRLGDAFERSIWMLCYHEITAATVQLSRVVSGDRTDVHLQWDAQAVRITNELDRDGREWAATYDQRQKNRRSDDALRFDFPGATRAEHERFVPMGTPVVSPTVSSDEFKQTVAGRVKWIMAVVESSVSFASCTMLQNFIAWTKTQNVCFMTDIAALLYPTPKTTGLRRASYEVPVLRAITQFVYPTFRSWAFYRYPATNQKQKKKKDDGDPFATLIRLQHLVCGKEFKPDQTVHFDANANVVAGIGRRLFSMVCRLLGVSNDDETMFLVQLERVIATHPLVRAPTTRVENARAGNARAHHRLLGEWAVDQCLHNTKNPMADYTTSWLTARLRSCPADCLDAKCLRHSQYTHTNVRVALTRQQKTGAKQLGPIGCMAYGLFRSATVVVPAPAVDTTTTRPRKKIRILNVSVVTKEEHVVSPLSRVPLSDITNKRK